MMRGIGCGVKGVRRVIVSRRRGKTNRGGVEIDGVK